jgi:carbamate kinase
VAEPSPTPPGRLLVLAIGGNALVRSGQAGTIAEQVENVRVLGERVCDVAEDGWRVLLTHGNGPQVGSALLRSEMAAHMTYTLPLDVCVADTQGGMGYVLQQAVGNSFRHRGRREPVVSVVTQVRVRRDDPAFGNPTKPIGPFYSASDAERRTQSGWQMVEDAGRGYRRVVASPEPDSVVEVDALRVLLDSGCVVIAGGGGGVPVSEDDHGLGGVEAVIDKDRTSALIAMALGADTLLIATGEERIALDYRKPTQRWLDHLLEAEAVEHLAAGQFPPGSMGPKVEAALTFLRGGGGSAIVTTPERVREALHGQAGTRIALGGAS